MTELQALRARINDGAFMKQLEKEANDAKLSPEFIKALADRIDHLKKSHTSQRDQ